MTTDDLTLYGKSNYFSDLISRINTTKPGDSVVLATMSFDPQPEELQMLADALYASSSRGVSTTFAIDAESFLLNQHTLIGPLWFSKTIPKHLTGHYRQKLKVLNRLEDAGAQTIITNIPSHPFSMPFGGRSHIKLAIVNDYVYVGGCNLTKVCVDLMVGWRDRATADWLKHLMSDVVKTKNVCRALMGNDVARKLDDHTELLIDAGVSKRSIIYDRALELIDQAEKSIFITCPYFPNSVTTERLLRAYNRGVSVTILYNHPMLHRTLYPLHQGVVWRERRRAPRVFFTNQLPRSHLYLHSKLIATEKCAILGSHNFVTTGVNLGTAEIALVRYDPEFSIRTIAAVRQQLSI